MPVRCLRLPRRYTTREESRPPQTEKQKGAETSAPSVGDSWVVLRRKLERKLHAQTNRPPELITVRQSVPATHGYWTARGIGNRRRVQQLRDVVRVEARCIERRSIACRARKRHAGSGICHIAHASWPSQRKRSRKVSREPARDVLFHARHRTLIEQILHRR